MSHTMHQGPLFRLALRFPLPKGKVTYSIAKKGILGVRREEKSIWERRAPLCPWHIKQLVQQNIKVMVQPSTRRVFHDREFAEAGATIVEDLSDASLILGIKEVPIKSLIPNRTYMFFSHVRKAQPYNMPMLDDILNKNIRLVDYELMKNDQDQRLVQFGLFAGYAGMIDFLHCLGRRLLHQGHSTAFLHIAPTYCYASLETARQAIRSAGQHIRQYGIPEHLAPLTFVFTGSGKVSTGAQQILQELPLSYIHPNKLPGLSQQSRKDTHTIYACVAEPEHYLEKNEQENALQGEELRHDYYQHPSKYRSSFHSLIAPFASAIINGIYWEPRYPRLLTLDQMRDLYGNRDGNGCKLLGVADISCDIQGSIEFTRHATTIEDPFFVYKPDSDDIHNSMNTPGVLVMSTDILPAELARDASAHFGDCLMPWIPEALEAPMDLPPNEAFKSRVLQKATITWNNNLLPEFQYISQLRTANSDTNKINTAKPKILILGAGYVAQPVIDILKQKADITLATYPPISHSDKEKFQHPNVHYATVNVASEADALASLIGQHDLVVSLVPAINHIYVADACIHKRKNMVTASYISPAMKSRDNDAKQSNIIILNEIGLDPGLDHLTTKRLVDIEHQRGNKIRSFISWCGGLPAPEASNNPFGYKFSWSPKGVLLAALNDAQYLFDGQIVKVQSNDLLSSTKKVSLFRGFNLEGIPNRDSLIYRDLYGLKDAHTVFRGTLRYGGFCQLLDGFKKMGFLDNEQPIDTITRLIKNTMSPETISHKTGWPINSPEMRDFMNTCIWLFDQPLAEGSSVLDVFSKLLEMKMSYGKNEKDIVLLHHELISEEPSGDRYKLTCSLVAYGDHDTHKSGNYTAMAKTVGFPVAAAAELLLSKDIFSSLEKGIMGPMKRDIYEPLLLRLEELGITFIETREKL